MIPERYSKLSHKKWFYAAACFVIIAGFSAWFAMQQNTNEKLFHKYYQTYPNVVAPTVRGTQLEDIKTEAFNAYDNGDYLVAQKLFDQIYLKEKSDYALLYKSLSLMELKEYASAKQNFKKFDYTQSSSLSIYFKWYLSLAELKTDEKANAITTLKDLSKTENPMQEMAKKLLADLE